jgi:hypothetical protein
LQGFGKFLSSKESALIFLQSKRRRRGIGAAFESESNGINQVAEDGGRRK